MTVITLTAVGFKEVRPLSELGQDFTMVLLGRGDHGGRRLVRVDHIIYREIRPW